MACNGINIHTYLKQATIDDQARGSIPHKNGSALRVYVANEHRPHLSDMWPFNLINPANKWHKRVVNVKRTETDPCDEVYKLE